MSRDPRLYVGEIRNSEGKTLRDLADDQGNSGRLPLKSAYRFMAERGLGETAEIVRATHGRLKSYNSTVRRGRVISILQATNLLDEFVKTEWPAGMTAGGRSEIQACIRVYQRFLEQHPEGSNESQAAPARENSPNPTEISARRTAQSRAKVRRGTTAEVIRSDRPYSNLVKLRDLVRRADRFIWWADRYFNNRGLEELMKNVDLARVKDIRILSGDDRIDDRTSKDFDRFQKEIKHEGVVAEWRILKRFSHDRFVISESFCVNAPSIDTILSGQYSEILETPNTPPFEEWWSQATPLQ